MKDFENSADLSLPPELIDQAISLPASPVTPAIRAEVTAKDRRSSTAFSPGDLLANRFRILRFVARGGMGEVYEADDLELGETIALKTVLPAIAHDQKMLTLLKAEVQLSRKVTHPNVCRIFDLACHRDPSPNVPPIWFVTMELLRGHSLTREIQQAGKLPIDRVLPLAEQMASGLEAARRAGVVHGDFKSGNVLLVRGADNTVRAVITDFGLARTLEAARDSRSARVGTPAYMAPEQVKGEALSPQTDVYSFGVVLYEMVTGQWPFNADSPERIAEKRLTEAPVPPVRFVPKLEPAWNRVILKCLARNPTERYSSAVAAIDEITGRSRIRKRVVAAASLLFVVAGASIATARYNELGPFRPKPQIAVLGWLNQTGDPAQQWISTELSERLSRALQQSTSDDVVPQQDVERAKIEFSVPADRNLDREDLSEFRMALGANSFVSGSYSMRDGRLVVEGSLQGTKGRVIERFQESGSAQNLAEIVKNIAAKLAAKLDGKEVSEREIDAFGSIYPKGQDARRIYFEALERLRSFDAVTAKTKLEQVVALEGNSVAAHAALAEAWSRLKHDGKAVEEGEKAASLARKEELPAELLQTIEARYAELQQRWSDAASRYKALSDFFPGQLSYSLSYAAALTRSGHPADALTFLDGLAAKKSPIGDDPRIQFARADAFAAESKFSDELKAASLSLDYAGRRKEKLMQASADLKVCAAQQSTGHYPEALQACQAAENIFSTFEDNVSAAVAQNGIANIKMEQSDYKGAEQAYRQVLSITQNANAEVDTCGALLNLAKSEIYLGDTAQTELHLNQSIDLAQRIEDHGDESRARILLGSVLSDSGKKDEAAQQYTAALKIGEATGDRDVQAYAWSGLGQASLDQHDLAAAETDFRKALALRNDMGEPAGITKLQLRLASLLLARGESATARELAEKARATAERLGDTGTMADSLCLLAEVDLSKGDSAASFEKSSRAVALYKGQHDVDSEAEAHLLSARAYFQEHKLPPGMDEIAQARALSGTTEETRRDIEELFKRASSSKGN
jgi:eukaryotic-like serine/threonine-protein kinase